MKIIKTIILVLVTLASCSYFSTNVYAQEATGYSTVVKIVKHTIESRKKSQTSDDLEYRSCTSTSYDCSGSADLACGKAVSPTCGSWRNEP